MWHTPDIPEELFDGTRVTAAKLAALADPTRVQLVMYILYAGRADVTTLALAIGRPMQATSWALACLRSADLVLDTRAGRHVVYEIHPDALIPPRLPGHLGGVRCGTMDVHFDLPDPPELTPDPAPKAKRPRPPKKGKRHAA